MNLNLLFPSSFTSFLVHHLCVGRCFVDLDPKHTRSSWLVVGTAEYKTTVCEQKVKYKYCAPPPKVFFRMEFVFAQPLQWEHTVVSGNMEQSGAGSGLFRNSVLPILLGMYISHLPSPIVTSKVHPISRSGCRTKEDYGRRQEHQKGN